MSKRYDKRILSDALCELGKTLGRPPTPKDLTPDMARRKTYLRHFSSWEEALEYAGFTQEPAEETPLEEKLVEKTADGPNQKQTKIKLVNLCGRPIVFLGPNGESETIPVSGDARLSLETKQPSAAKLLAAEIENARVISVRLKNIFVSIDGNRYGFPPPAKDTYYITSEAVARNIYRFGRSSTDLLYLKDFHKANDVLYVEALGMVYTKNLPVEA